MKRIWRIAVIVIVLGLAAAEVFACGIDIEKMRAGIRADVLAWRCAVEPKARQCGESRREPDERRREATEERRGATELREE